MTVRSRLAKVKGSSSPAASLIRYMSLLRAACLQLWHFPQASQSPDVDTVGAVEADPIGAVETSLRGMFDPEVSVDRRDLALRMTQVIIMLVAGTTVLFVRGIWEGSIRSQVRKGIGQC